MNNNSFLMYLALGVVLMSSTFIFGFPDKPKDNTIAVPPTELADFSGRWIADREGNAYELVLTQSGNELRGSHCFSIDNARQSDCDGIESINGTVTGDKALVYIASSFSDEPIMVNLAKKWRPNDEMIELTSDMVNDTVPTNLELERGVDKNFLIGIWHESPVTGSGWSDHYNFYPDGKFHFYYNQMDCAKRKVQSNGNWSLNGDVLDLETTSEVTLVGGKMLKSMGSCGTPLMLEGASETIIELKNPVKEIISIVRVPKEKDLGATNPSVLINGKQFWKFADDPTGYENEFPE